MVSPQSDVSSVIKVYIIFCAQSINVYELTEHCFFTINSLHITGTVQSKTSWSSQKSLKQKSNVLTYEKHCSLRQLVYTLKDHSSVIWYLPIANTELLVSKFDMQLAPTD